MFSIFFFIGISLAHLIHDKIIDIHDGISMKNWKLA